MKNIKFKTTNLKEARFYLKNASAPGFRKRFCKLRDTINRQAAPHENFDQKDGTSLLRPLTIDEMRERFPEDELPVCNVSVHQNGNDIIVVFTAPAKAVRHFDCPGKDILAYIPDLWFSQEHGWVHDRELRPIVNGVYA